ncbi:MAG: putative transport system permease protein [Acidobacteriota bacterium]|nr:putative transport system permease protein [Acidobacteriota bacterium]
MISADEEMKRRADEGDSNVAVDEGADEREGGGAGRKVFWGQAVAFLLGVALLVYVLRRVGIQPVFDALAQIGLGLFLLFSISGLRHLIRAAAMRIAVAPEHRKFSLWQAFITRLGGEAVSFLTFTGPILGEATKAALLKKRVPLIAGAQALVVDNLLYNLSVALFILSGAVVMLISYDLPAPAHYTLLLIAGSATFVLALVGYALSRRVKPISWLLDKMKDRRLEPQFLRKRDEHIHRVESYVYKFYQQRSGAFFVIVALDLLSHATSVWEVFATLRMLGLRPGASAPYIIESLTKVINFVFGFVPATIGVYEGGTGVILHTLGYAAATGVTLGLVRKAGMIFWTTLGLIVLSYRALPTATRRLIDRHPRLRKAMDNLVLSNIAHRPARTFVTVLGVGVGVLLVIFTVGLAHGVLRERGRREASVGAEIMVRASGSMGFSGQQPFAVPVAHANELARIAGVRAAVPLGQTTASSETGFGVRLVDGIDFDSYSRLAGTRIVEGRALEKGDEAIVDPLWIEQNKRDAQARVGGTVKLYERLFRIVGVFEPPGGGRIKIPLATMQDQLGSEGRVSSILVACMNPAEQDAVAARIHAAFPEDQIIFTRDLSELYATGVPALNVFISVIVAIASAISVLVILLAMYTTVTERTRQIGILKSLGMSNTKIAWVIEQEAIAVSVLGVALGLALTLAARFALMRVSTLSVEIEPRWIIFSLLIGLVGGTIGALYPALRAARQDAVEALSYE